MLANKPESLSVLSGYTNICWDIRTNHRSDWIFLKKLKPALKILVEKDLFSVQDVQCHVVLKTKIFWLLLRPRGVMEHEQIAKSL